jgi:hypothetical protein
MTITSQNTSKFNLNGNDLNLINKKITEEPLLSIKKLNSNERQNMNQTQPFFTNEQIVANQKENLRSISLRKKQVKINKFDRGELKQNTL